LGRERLATLDARGVARFSRFTQDWSAEEVRHLGELLEKLEASIAAAVRDEPPVTAVPWRRPPGGGRPPGDAAPPGKRDPDDADLGKPG
jgi:hypothetical protein